MTEVEGSKRRTRWLELAVVAVVAGFFVVTLLARWREVAAAKWRLDPGFFALASLVLASSYGLVATLW